MPSSSQSSETNAAVPAKETAPAPLHDSVATVLGRIPSGLFVVTWREADVDRFMLASWVMPFDGIEIVRGASGAPAIATAAGWLECRSIAQVPGGDHTIVVAEVTNGKTGSAEQPLVHIRRNGLRY
jgi:flavin reductase (DIM6/NTAB) family NADH-FMN oxidoreductase RutF